MNESPRIFELSRTLTLAVVLMLAVGCDSLTGSDDDEPAVAAIIQSATATGASVSLESGTPGQDGSAPVASVSGNQTMIPGGGTGFTITADSPFSQVFTWVEGEDGYYRLDFGAPRETADLILAYGNELAGSQYEFGFAVGTGQGAGAAARRQMNVVSVGTGDVQVSVSWDVASDVDLYVVEPNGEEIFYGDRTSSSGGELDLDSNAACGGQDLRNENITWEESAAPRGEYVVRVNYWDSCGVARTNWVVTVRVRGQPTRSFTGFFTGEGVGGASGAGEVVTTFTY